VNPYFISKMEALLKEFQGIGVEEFIVWTKFQDLLLHVPHINLPTYGYVLTYLNTYIFVFKIQLICHVATFDYATCHNPRPSKTNNHNGQWMSIFQKNHKFFFIVPCVKCWWMDEKWCQHDIMIIVIGELHSSWKWVVATKL